MVDLLDTLRTALDERYVIERELGRGGMAVVFLARDVKHERLVALKVMRPEVGATLGAERFLHEIKVAARLQHPHILAVHDSGRAGAYLYYVMPYVEGETLRDRLRREGRLRLDDALRIAGQVADALAYAHAQGVVHRDVKPENILLASWVTGGTGGHAVVADFGIARAVVGSGGEMQTATGVIFGSPVYMSPEQAGGERDLDGRSDLYSLGCVLYEMLGGRPPFGGETTQAILSGHMVDEAQPLSELAPDVPAAVERAVERALAKKREDRFAAAGDFARAIAPAMTSGEIGRPRGAIPRAWRRVVRRLGRRSRVPLVLAALAPLSAAAIVMLRPGPQVAFEKRDWVLVADVENATGEPLFDRSLGTALTAGIQQSPHVNVFPRARVQQTLARMRRAGPDTLLQEAVAREVARREGVRILIASAVARLDSTYLLTARLVEPATGHVLETAEARVVGRSGMIRAVDELSRQIRRALGESRISVARQSQPLPQVTTASLEALQKYADGRTAWGAIRRDEAANHFEGAIALDSGFALAHVEMGAVHSWQNNMPKAEWHFAQAFRHMDRLTERERDWARARIEGWRGNRDGAVSLLRAYLAQYPDDRSAWYTLGYELMRGDRARESIEAYQRLFAIDSLNAGAYTNVAADYLVLGKPDSALVAYARAFALRPDFELQENLNHEYGMALIEAGRADDARASFTRMTEQRTPGERARGLRSLALLDMRFGRYRAARPHLEQAVALSLALKNTTSEARNRLYLAAVHRMRGDPAAERRELDQTWAIFERAHLDPYYLTLLGAAYARHGQLRRVETLADSARRRTYEYNKTGQANLRALEAALALLRGKPPEAVQLLEQGIAFDSLPRLVGALAEAQTAAGDVAGAVRTLERLRATRALGAESQEYWVLAPYRLGQLHERLGDRVAALRAYKVFLDDWKDADADLPAAKEARARVEALARAP